MKVTIILLALTSAHCEINYQNTIFNGGAGMYFDKLGTGRTYNQHWKIVSYVDTDYLSEKFGIIDRFSDRVNNICFFMKEHEDKILCKQTAHLLNIKIPLLKRKELILKTYISHTHREKRGLVNVIGSGLKALFGTMDSDDAHNIDSSIDELQKSNINILTLVKDQTSIIQTTIHNFNHSFLVLKKNEELMNENFNKISKFQTGLINQINKIDFSINLLEQLSSLNMLVTELETDYDMLTNAVLFGQRNQLHPSILSPKQLVEELVKTITHLPENLAYPVQVNIKNAYKILLLLKLSIHYDNNNLIFIIEIPLVDNKKYDLFNVIPMPIKIENKFVFIEPTLKNLLITSDKYTFIDIQPDLCIEIENEYICELDSTPRNPFITKTCETEILLGASTIPLECKTRVVNQNIESWHRLHRQNTWLYAITTPKTLTLKCKSDVEDIKLESTGKISINSQCTGYTTTTMLLPTLNLTSNFTVKQPSLDLREDCCARTNIASSIDVPELQNVKFGSLKLEDLDIASHQLQKIQDNILDIMTSPKAERHFNIITYTVGIITIIILVFFLYSCFKNFKFWQRCFTTTGRSSYKFCINIFSNNTTETTNPTDLQVSFRRNSEELEPHHVPANYQSLATARRELRRSKTEEEISPGGYRID